VIYNSRLDWPPVLQTAAGMHSTAEDMAKWIVALQNGTLLTQASVAEMQSPVPLEGGRPGTWGIGWLMGQTAKGRVCAPAGGCKSQIVIYPDGLSVVLLTNLIGGIPEQFQAVSGQEIDVRFIDPIAEHFVG
jgi:CubicO group peptidase (beta-lactamase class C family)